MRSIKNRINSLGNQSASRKATVIVRKNASRPAAFYSALFGYASRYMDMLRDALGDWPTVTRTTTPRVTGGACHATSWQGSGRHATMCRLAAR